MKSCRRARRFWRRVAPLVIFSFAWTFTGSPAAQALAMARQQRQQQRAGQRGHTRALSPAEMNAIVGGNTHATPVSTAPGSPYSWEAGVGGTNTGNGNKLTAIPLFGWTERGGLPIRMTLSHNSEGSHNSELGYKWTFSFDIYLVVDGLTGNVVVHWGDDLAYQFTRNLDGSYTPRTGIHDTFVANGSPTITSYDLTTKSQVKYHFTNPNGTGWYVASIKDRNNNTVTVNHNASDYVTTIVDPTNRTITLGYDANNRITSITDPLSRQWTLSYTSGNLTQVSWPAVGGNAYTQQFGYDLNHCITSYTDRRGKVWSFTYYSDGSLNTAKDPCNNQSTWTYTSSATTISDPNSHSTIYTYSGGRLASVTDALSLSESYGYDTDNNRTSVTDRRGKLWQYTFDSRGNVLTATDPLLHTTTWTFNSFNDPLTVTDHAGHKSVMAYDASGNLTQVQEKDASNTLLSTTTYTPNSDGTLASKTDNNSHTTTSATRRTAS